MRVAIKENYLPFKYRRGERRGKDKQRKLKEAISLAALFTFLLEQTQFNECICCGLCNCSVPREQTSRNLNCYHTCDDEQATHYSSKFALCCFMAAEFVLLLFQGFCRISIKNPIFSHF